MGNIRRISMNIEEFKIFIKNKKKQEAFFKVFKDAGFDILDNDISNSFLHNEDILIFSAFSEVQAEYLFNWMYDCKFGTEENAIKNLYSGDDLDMVWMTLNGLESREEEVIKHILDCDTGVARQQYITYKRKKK